MDHVYLVVSDCGDYYCGCGLGHLAAVATSRAKAEALLEQAQRVEYSYGSSAESAKHWYPLYAAAEIVEVPVGVVLPGDRDAIERVRAEA
jgi:hypothetical protein